LKNIGIVQKCPSNVDYTRHFGFLGTVTVHNLSSEKVTRLLKRDIDIEGFSTGAYDWVILVGSEAVKEFSTVTAVSDYTGKLVPGKRGETNLIACISPAMLAFKPESKPVFDASIKSISDIVAGEVKELEVGDFKGIRSLEETIAYLKFVLGSKVPVVALDSETSALAPRDGYMLGISMSHCRHQGVYLDAAVFDGEASFLLQEIIEQYEVVFHNAKFDMGFFTYHLGIDFSVAKKVHDTMIQHYLLDERQGTHGLKSLTMKYGSLGDYDSGLEEFKTNYCHSHGLKKEEFSYDLIPWDIIWPYAAKDTAATIELHEKFLPLIEKNPKLQNCYYNLMLPALMFLTKMEDRGVPVHVKRLEAAKEILVKEIHDAYIELYKFPEVVKFEESHGKRFNPQSTIQLRSLLFDYVGMTPTGALTATGAISTDADVLLELAKEHKIPEIILTIRKKTKLVNTYINKLIPAVDKDGRVRTGFNLTSTTSGRLSSSGKFNMQQLPRDNPIIKGAVVAKKGYKIVAVDLTTAEVYFAAVLSGDRQMQQVFINMQREPDKYPDFHGSIAHMVFNLPCEPAEVKKLYPALRQGAKAITFGILYGSGPSKVAESVNLALKENGQPETCTTEDAKEYISIYFSKFKRLKQWIDECHTEIKTNGYIYNFFGRKRRLHNIRSVDRSVVGAEIRSGFNAIIQSVSSDHLLLGAIDADNEILERKIDARIFALVHDSVVAEVADDQVETYLEILIRNLQKDRGCSIPGYPIGVDQDTEPGGSENYSGAKLKKVYPNLAEIV
jgi:DNA polymerase I-like protein with 3'-5' exonuclease and polymerase domains